jgi:periplasmic divalent cation tolerance protein
MVRRDGICAEQEIRVDFLAMSDARIVLTTTGSKDEAMKIAHALVDRRLAACVNVIPKIESVYRFQDNVESSDEWLLLIKTIESEFEAVRDAIKELHTYELPECIAIKVSDGSKECLDWIAESVKKG